MREKRHAGSITVAHDAGKAGGRGRGGPGRGLARGQVRGAAPAVPRSQGPSPPNRSQTASPLPRPTQPPRQPASVIQQLLSTATLDDAPAVRPCRVPCPTAMLKFAMRACNQMYIRTTPKMLRL